ncbi:MAG: peptidylprolyl isomerase [Planctomycetes bacterium]|nr:peptidylprolyl isomerase [Planctomycetota bacterium]
MRFALPLLVLATISAGETQVEIRTSLGSITCRLFDAGCPVTVGNFCALAEGTRASRDLTSGQLVNRPFYDGLIFHRVIPGFMIQGGDPKGDGTGGPGFQFKDEINAVSLGLDRELALQGDQLHPQCAYMGRQFVMTYIEPKLQGRQIGPDAPAEKRNAAIAEIIPQLQTVSLMQFYKDLGYHYDDSLPASRKPMRGVLAMANSGPDTNGSQFFINLGDTPHLTGKHTVFGEVVAGMEVAIAIAAVPRDERDKPLQPVRIIGIRPLGSRVPWPGEAPATTTPAPDAPAAAPTAP